MKCKIVYATNPVLIEVSDSPWHVGHAIYPNGRDGGAVVSHATTIEGLFKDVASVVKCRKVAPLDDDPKALQQCEEALK